MTEGGLKFRANKYCDLEMGREADASVRIKSFGNAVATVAALRVCVNMKFSIFYRTTPDTEMTVPTYHVRMN